MSSTLLKTATWILVFSALATEVLAQPTVEDLKRLTLEDLISIEVSTVSRMPERTTVAPAAVYVITQEDIRRSGASSLPEVLRLAPGVQVARIDASRYAVGMRGFADRLARSMLVLVDGRAVYSPLFAGTYWEVQHTLLDDIERIEVIRGPGGTLWGANAVNGIINIVTKAAQDTQGVFVRAAAGSEPHGLLGVRFGGAAGPSFHYRIYAKAFDRGAQFQPAGLEYDDWRMVQSGFRGDWLLPASRSLTLQGDVYAVRLGQRTSLTSYTPPFARVGSRTAPLSGGNVLARWAGPTGTGRTFQLQTFYDRTNRDEVPVAEVRDTFDVDFQYRHPLSASHELVWGVGYRVTAGRITAIAHSAFLPPDRTDHLVSAFVQDEVALVRDRLRVSFGTKLERNAYSGVEFQPSGRLTWSLNPAHTIVASVTRAVRTPSRVETDYTTTSLADPATPAFVRLLPNPEFEAERLVAYEAGYRVRPVGPVYVTVSAFYNHLDNVLSTDLLPAFFETTPPPNRRILPVTFRNGLQGNSHGVELTGEVRPLPWWRWTAGYSFLRIQMTRKQGSTDVSQERRYEGLSPRHQVQVRSSLDLPKEVALDWFFRYVSALPAGPIPEYGTSNLRLAWPIGTGFELAVVGENLHRRRHVEWPSGAGANAQVERSVYVNLTWRR
jgi:iron complex outermembrane receptor protein